MSRFLSGGLWAEALLGILSLLALPRGTLGDCDIADLPVFTYSEPAVDTGLDSVPENHEIKYRCKPGFINIPGRTETSTCVGNSWSKIEDLCAVSVVKCEEPTVENGIKLSGIQHSYTSGDHMTFECKIGYFLIGSYFIQCENNTWHPEVPRCKKIAPKLCGAPVIPKGRVEPQLPQYEFGRAISLHCKSNHYFTDETIEMIITCKGYNVWEPPPQPCFLRTSNDTHFLIIYNGKITDGKKNAYEPGDEVVIQCDPGYALNGPEHIRYIGRGRWLPELPSCSLSAFFKLLIAVFVLFLLLLAVKMIYQKCRTL